MLPGWSGRHEPPRNHPHPCPRGQWRDWAERRPSLASARRPAPVQDAHPEPSDDNGPQDSLPGLLDGRRHIVLTRDADWQEEGAEPVHSVEEAIRIANAPHISVIGGAEIFALFLDLADRIELTQVHIEAQGDTYMEPFDPVIWQEAAREEHEAEGGRPGYSFVTLRRKAAP